MRTPSFLQLSQTECAAACLGSVLAHYRRWASIEDLREACAVGRDGSTAADVVRGARSFGLEASGWRMGVSDLARVQLPVVLHWGFDHFVVLEAIRRNGYQINDPARGRLVVAREQFDHDFTGVVLQMRPGDDFQPGGTRPGIVHELRPWLRHAGRPLAFAALCGLLLAIPGLLLPAVLSVFIDEVIGGGGPTGWGPLLVLAAAGIGAVSLLLVWLQQNALNRLAVRLAVEHSSGLVDRLLRLPERFFFHRYAGDLAHRASMPEGIASTATAGLAAMAIQLTVSLVYLAAIFFYEPFLAAVLLVMAVANAAALSLVHRMRRGENEKMQREVALLAGVTGFGLRNIELIKATSAEDHFFRRWSGQQAREFSARQKFAELGSLAATLPGLFMTLGAAAVLGFGGWRVMSGDLTIGLLVGLLTLAAGLLSPVGRLVVLAEELRHLEAQARQVSDVMTTPVDTSFASNPSETATTRVATLQGRLRLAGAIDVRNLTFGYRANRGPLIEDFCLTVDPGQRVAVVGATGSGKTTLLKLLSGEYAPWSGEIRFDGCLLPTIPREILNNSVAVVDQHILMFSGTVRDNLTLWNAAASDRQLVQAAADALIHDDIVSRTAGYDSPVREAARNFSRGQCQRLEIARALVNSPSVLVLDEATSALDAVSEKQVHDALRRRGCTCVIVAHRLSTVRDCDQIIVLERGRVVQRGVHDDLIADTDGAYCRIMQSQ